jgi:hypothetical protein
MLLVGGLTAPVLLLMPGQGQVMVGAEVLAVGLATWGCVVAIQLLRLRSWGTMRPDLRRPFMVRMALGQIATLPLVVAGIAVLGGGFGGYTGWWRAWSSRSSWWLYSGRGCCSSRSTGRRIPILLTFIQRSAWKGNSAKFACRIVHKTPHQSCEDGFFGYLRRAGEDYMLWWCIKIRGRE